MIFWNVIEAGTYIIIPLALLLIAALWIWLARVLKLRAESKPVAAFMQRIRDYVVEGDLENARQLCSLSVFPASKIINRGVNRIGSPISEVADAMNEQRDVEKIVLGKGIGWLAAIAVISPLLGAVGTLIGITYQFNEMTSDGVNFSFDVLSNALTQTLITFICGLGVGIIAIFFRTSLEGIRNKREQELCETSVEFLDLLNEPV